MIHVGLFLVYALYFLKYYIHKLFEKINQKIFTLVEFTDLDILQESKKNVYLRLLY